ncbi:tyrosine-type recombinase/integrase [Labrenzia aggregata]|uniref:Tyrosine-type recombinase/integrase n=2 Tax=Roseibium aggregatum TaxID=187304 RepID=A0A926P6E2_9HYPH|nr:tyrosine-type recombinase/integrase [Roseibium aggregatum]
MGVPKELRDLIGKRELIKALGGDRQVALRALPEVIAGFNRQIDDARERLQTGSPARQPPAFCPLTIEEIAARHYREQLELDEEFRDLSSEYSNSLIDDQHINKIKEIASAKANNDLISNLLGNAIERYRTHGFHDFPAGSPSWRRLARFIAHAELEALHRTCERDEAKLEITHPQWALDHLPNPTKQFQEQTTSEKQPEETSIRALFKLCRKAKTGSDGDGRTTEAYTRPIESLIEFLGSDNVTAITNRKISKWLSHLQFEQGLAPKTINSRYLSAVKSTLKWAGNHGYIDPIAITASVTVPKKRLNREKGYNADEAAKVLQFAFNYQRPKETRESIQLSAAKRWAPWLAHFTGARIGEITQLRKQDILQKDGIPYLRITPDAGTTKTGHYRDVPLHRQLIDQGFLKFVEDTEQGPLFYPKREGKQDPVKSAETISNRVAKWIKGAGLVPAEVAPLHGFRHAFKTNARIHGLSDRIADAIQGHAGRTAGDDYGDVTIAVRKREIDKLPDVSIA